MTFSKEIKYKNERLPRVNVNEGKKKSKTKVLANTEACREQLL